MPESPVRPAPECGVPEADELVDAVEVEEALAECSGVLETNPLLKGAVALAGMTEEWIVVEAGSSPAEVTVLTRTSVLVIVFVNVEVEVSAVTS
ncbi:hypothetical protein EYZ11_004745 [Aspergillus tanneri]|uniref:Uncharacterized protein n=1 Tax=Aspergillus tanneri TaxID=1220188 RepID=A0A4S3JK42_9EURO|nr:hypothetical protein EYZ11_004745 [Aspergillus tanneri]